jgi:hypothetical protein
MWFNSIEHSSVESQQIKNCRSSDFQFGKSVRELICGGESWDHLMDAIFDLTEQM